MLIFLDQSLLDSLAIDSSHLSPTVIAIDLAAEAARQGTHLLCGEISTFDLLLEKSSVFSQRTLMLLARSRSKLPFRGELASGIMWHVRLTTEVIEPTSRTNAGGQIEVLLPPICVAVDATLLGLPRFIPENNNDGHFYEALTYSLIETDPEYQKKFGTVTLRFDLLQGGGSTTAAVYSHEKNNKNRFCLAVTDSDQTYPGSPLGQTALKVREVDGQPTKFQWNARALILGVRAVENLFPADSLLNTAESLDKALGEKATVITACHFGQSHWNYLPLKKGVRCFEVKDLASHEARYQAASLKFHSCPNRSATPCENAEKCDTYIVEPLGSNLLAKLCSKKPIKLRFDLETDALNLPAVRQLGLEMISAFCGDQAVLGH